MKLLFYDKFFDSLINLPKGTQKKVVEFQKKFRENSKSTAIHLEPIAATKDKSLRSARVDQTYRAIIKVPDSGDIYYLLWVDHHDKAYDWATNKMFHWNDETQSMQVFTVPDEPIEIQNKDEKVETELKGYFSRYKKDQLLKIGVPEILLPSIAKIETLDDLERIEKFIPQEVFENLFYLFDGASIDALITEIEEGKADSISIEDKVSSVNNQRSFIELTDDELFNEVLSGSLEKWKYYLHPSQRKLVSTNFKGSVKVSGGAGTGKTVAALHRLKYLVNNKETEEQILFTTFTKALTENIIHLAKGLNINLSKVTISNIDKLVREMIIDYNVLPYGFKVFELDAIKKPNEIWEEILSSELSSFDPEFLEEEYKSVILYHNVKSLDEYFRTSRIGRGTAISRRHRKELWKYFETFNSIKEKKNLYYKDELFNELNAFLSENNITPFDYCLVDELQDFSNVELRLIRSLVKEKPNDLFLVGDPMQRIYSRNINFSKAGIHIRGKRSHRLRINYRTTEEIKRLALSIIKDIHYDNFDGEEEDKKGYISLYHGNKPTYKLFKSKNEEVEEVYRKINELIENGYKYSDIAIGSRTRNGLKDFRNYFHKENIPFSDNEIKNIQNFESVALLTFHKLKGLEFKHVFLVDVNERTLPKLPFDFNTKEPDWQKAYLKNEKSLAYVAISRAIENVYITGVGSPSELINL